MNASDDYCELCDLPKSQCLHGRPPPAPPTEAVKPPPRARRPSVARSQRSAPPARKATLRWTPPDALKPLIVRVLEEAGGELETDELFVRLELLAGDVLRPADTETTPEGELRWRYAARRARVALIAEGLMTKGRPGVWQLA